MLRRVLFFALLLTAALPAATLRLYLKDGNYHSVREYEVKGERVRYYSTERGDWEEVPIALVDLGRTEGEMKELEEKRKQETAMFDAEEKFEREQRREIERVPYDPGVYQVSGEKVDAIKQPELKTVKDKKRSILKIMTPIPLIAGRQTVEVEGAESAYMVSTNRPEFYFRLAAEEKFGIARLKPSKTGRVVQVWQIAPVSSELFEEMETVEVFKKQLASGLYKIWPTEPLSNGEYAVYEYTEGKANVQIWDFSVRGSNVPYEPPAKKKEPAANKD